MITLYTIGHSNRSYGELVEALRAWEVETLVDIRHFGRWRANPQFNESVLARKLPRDGIDYVALRELGGRRARSKMIAPERNAGWQNSAFKNYADYAETPAFAAGLATLLRRAARSTCAIMCAEVLWWRCHRRIVADYALARGARVFHIFTPAKAERARRTPFAKLDRKTHTLRYPPSTPTREPKARASTRSPAGRTRSASRPARAARGGPAAGRSAARRRGST
jgi:uncharacterized protein (DUF488 family)